MTSTLPENFDGIFRFTNSREEEFKAKWNNIEYTFPGMKTTPMIIPDASPEQVQSIRKKFAREWGIEQWYKSPKFVGMNTHTPGGTPALYTEEDLKPFIQKCLEPLPIAQAKVKVLPKTFDEDKLTKDEDGRPRTRVLKEKESLVAQGSGAID